MGVLKLAESLIPTSKMGREDKTSWKANYFVKLIQLLDEYPKCFIVGADNVGSKQLQQIRRSLRMCFCPYGQEHHDPESHLWPLGEQPSLGKASPSHQGKCWLRFHQQ